MTPNSCGIEIRLDQDSPGPPALLSTLTPECLDAIRDMIREEMDAAIDAAGTVEHPYTHTSSTGGVAVTVGFATREELLAYLVARGVITEREREQMLGLLAAGDMPPRVKLTEEAAQSMRQLLDDPEQQAHAGYEMPTTDVSALRDTSGHFQPIKLDARPILLPQGLWQPESSPSESKPPPVCTCPIADLMTRGCTCGALST